MTTLILVPHQINIAPCHNRLHPVETLTLIRRSTFFGVLLPGYMKVVILSARKRGGRFESRSIARAVGVRRLRSPKVSTGPMS